MFCPDCGTWTRASLPRCTRCAGALPELPARLAPYETGQRGMGDPSRWNNERELEWIELRPELVVEVTFDHVSNDRIRHGTKLSRWREDKDPAECRIDQLAS